MPTVKLHELIEILKTQGVQNGEEKAEQIVASARKQAEEILEKAQSQAKIIVDKADSEADQTLKRLQSSMEIAASQFVGNLKRVIENQLLSIPLKSKLGEDLSNPDFLKELMTRFVSAYASDPARAHIRLLLPAGTQDELKTFAVELMGRHYADDGDRLSLVMESHGVKFGFQVDKKEGHVRLDFTDDAFLALFKEFLTPKFREFFSSMKPGETR